VPEGKLKVILKLSKCSRKYIFQYFVEAGAMAVRRCKKVDLKRIAKATGATFVTSLSNMDGEESFEASFLGEAAEVVQDKISDDECILIKG
jgi:T-complex protein 1 subunit alpha